MLHSILFVFLQTNNHGLHIGMDWLVCLFTILVVYFSLFAITITFHLYLSLFSLPLSILTFKAVTPFTNNTTNLY